MTKVFETPDADNYFSGYYDRYPLSFDNQKLLACKVNFIDRTPNEDDVLEIGYFEWQKLGYFTKLAETRAWNWQQGCMLQWLGSDYNTKIIYNDRSGDEFVSVIMDVATSERYILPMAYYAASGNGHFILSIDNKRHYWHRKGYNYPGVEDFSRRKAVDEDDGIWRTDIDSREVTQVISLRKILSIKPLENMMNSTHYFEHIMINPSNTRFSFLHRWKDFEGAIFSRLYTANIDGGDIKLLNDSGRVSHYCWKNDVELVAWGGLRNTFNAIRMHKNLAKFLVRPLMPVYRAIAKGNSVDGNSKLSSYISGDSYLLVADKTSHSVRLAHKILTKDGHPSFSKADENIMLTDTYPEVSASYQQELILYNLSTDTKEVLDRVYHDSEHYGKVSRCDLHPKWSHDGEYIVVDTLVMGRRSVYLYHLEKEHKL